MAVVVFCPMEIERKAVARALREAGVQDVRVLQTGIGKDAVVRALVEAAAGASGRTDTKSLMVLAGACGGLALTEDVPRIAAVIDEHGGRWTPRSSDSHGAMLVAVDQVVATPADKKALAARTGAAIVDMETHAFAAECERRGLAWTVVRGVSDTPEETLPAEFIGWLKPDGGTRALRAAWDMVRNPSLVPHIIRVVRRANRVLPKVGARVVEIAKEWRGPDPAAAPWPPSQENATFVSPLPVPECAPLVILFGGTFDPPHLGHVELPRRVREALEAKLGCPGAAWLVYIPAARSPHKADEPTTSTEDRLRMLRIAIRGLERVATWDDEIVRARLESGPSYTVDTVRRARDWLDSRGGAAGGRGTRLRLLIGADQAAAFHRWREPRRIIDLAEPVVMVRGEAGADGVAILESLNATGFWTPDELTAWVGRIVPVGRINASGTDIRRAFATGNSAAVAGQMLPGLTDFIRARHLYGPPQGE